VQKAGVTARTCDRLAAAEHVPGGAKDEDDGDVQRSGMGSLFLEGEDGAECYAAPSVNCAKARLHVAAHGDAVETTIWVSASSGSETRP
jgi:hypothetical protein